MKAHYKTFKDFYFKQIGTLEKNWHVLSTVKEKTQAPTQGEEDDIAESPKQNRLCCLKLKPEESECEIEWHIVQLKWDEGESDLAHETHVVGQPKKTWEVCGSHSSFSYHMHLNPYYELAFRGVSKEHASESESEDEDLDSDFEDEDVPEGKLDVDEEAAAPESDSGDVWCHGAVMP